jgi:hypothetical protein
MRSVPPVHSCGKPVRRQDTAQEMAQLAKSNAQGDVRTAAGCGRKNRRTPPLLVERCNCVDSGRRKRSSHCRAPYPRETITYLINARRAGLHAVAHNFWAANAGTSSSSAVRLSPTRVICELQCGASLAARASSHPQNNRPPQVRISVSFWRRTEPRQPLSRVNASFLFQRQGVNIAGRYIAKQ